MSTTTFLDLPVTVLHATILLNGDTFNALRGTCRQMREYVDSFVTKCNFALKKCHDIGNDDKGVPWLAHRFPMLKTIDMSANRFHNYVTTPRQMYVRTMPACIRGSVDIGTLTELLVRHRLLTDEFIADLPKLTSLRKLDLCGCISKTIDVKLSAFLPTTLVHLDIAKCFTYEHLSWTTKLPCLQWLSVAWSKLHDMSHISKSKNLTHLDITGCVHVDKLVVPSSLKTLLAIYCINLSDLSPLRIADNLSYLDVTGCCRITSFVSYGGISKTMKHLTTTTLSEGNMYTLRQFENIETLDTHVYDDHETLMHIGKTLLHLRAFIKSNLKVDLACFTRLRSLQIAYLQITSSNVVWRSLTTLTSLDILETVDDFIGVDKMTSLQVLKGIIVDRVTDFSPLLKLTRLRTLELTLETSGEKVDFSSIAEMTYLDHFRVHGCKRMASLLPLATLAAFTSLKVSDLVDGDLGPLAMLSRLRALDFTTGYVEINSIRSLSILSSLTTVTIIDVAHVPCPLPTTLLNLSLKRCFKLVDLTPYTSSLARIDTLSIDRCPIRNLTPLSLLTTLKDLSIRYIDATDMSPLSTLVQLTHLVIRSQFELDYSPLVTCTALKMGVCNEYCVCEGG